MIGISHREKRTTAAITRQRNRISSWQRIIDDESYYITLISTVIICELRHLVTECISDDPKMAYFDPEAGILLKQVQRQACLVYHNLYRGEADYVTVREHHDVSINGRSGIINGFDPIRHEFLVRLQTKAVPCPGRFSGEKRLINARFLEQVPLTTYDHNGRIKTPIKPTMHPVVITAVCPRGEMHHVTIPIERIVLDVITCDGDTRSSTSLCHVRPLVAAAAIQSVLQNIVLGKRRRHRRRNRGSQCDSPCPAVIAPPVVECKCCPGGTSNPPGTHTCVDCGMDPSSPSLGIVVGTPSPVHDLGDDFIQQSGFDPNLLINRDALRFNLPFLTRDGILMSASQQLNELNLSPLVQTVQPEEVLCSRLVIHPVHINNGDLYSLYPHESISDSVIDLWNNWLVRVFRCIKSFRPNILLIISSSCFRIIPGLLHNYQRTQLLHYQLKCYHVLHAPQISNPFQKKCYMITMIFLRLRLL